MEEPVGAAQSQSVGISDVKDAVTCGICLQIFTDPRYLRCSHTYCFQCLVGYQTSSTWKECPVCRVDCIPNKADLHKLPVNQLAANLIGLVKGYEPDAVEPAAEWKPPENPKMPEKPSGSSVTNGSSLVSALSSGDSEPGIGSLLQTRGLRDAVMQADHGFALRHIQEVMERDSDLEMALAQSLSSMGTDDTAEGAEEDTDTSTESQSGGTEHTGIVCSKCNRVIRGDRYKCGICEGFEMCSTCAKKPRGMVHDQEHIFVKLKRPATNPTQPSRPVLHDDSTVMGMSIDTQSREHTIEHPRGTIVYNCHNCGVSPITGTRYKCGKCHSYDLCSECEKKSEEVHNPDHVFLEIPHPAGFHTQKPQLLYNFYSS